MPLTTIQISKQTREKFNKLKYYKKTTYDEIIGALMSLVPTGDNEGTYTEEFRASLLRSLLDINHGRTYTTVEVKKRLGI